MKVVFLNRFFFPDASATSQILSDLAFHLAERGWDVHVVTSRVPGGEQESEVMRGVKVHRVASAIAGPHGLLRRAGAYAGYYAGARAAARRLASPGDLFVAKTDPPLLSSAVGAIVRARGARMVAWQQDVFPEIAHEYGVPGIAVAYPLLRRVRNRTLAAADAVVAISERMADRLSREAARSVEVIHNWADGRAIAPLAHEKNDLRRQWDLEGRFAVEYSGNLGRVHEFDTLLGAARRLRAEQDMRFIIVGRGPRHDEVRERVEREGLDNVRLIDPQPRAMLSQALGAGDVHLTVLQPRFEGLVVPSKIYGIMAAGRPNVFIGDPHGESAAMLAQARGGVSVAAGDDAGLAAALLALRRDDAGRARMGASARSAFDQRYAMGVALERWESLLRSLAPAAP
jgi:glycosyltransferase involved in cell wall biosynthesis